MISLPNILLYWFRNDLRLSDNPVLRQACAQATQLLPVFCMPPATGTQWGFERVGAHRRALLASALQELQQTLSEAGSRLLVLDGPPADALPRLVRETGATAIICEDIAAPEEMAEVAALHKAGIDVRTHWQSTMLDPAGLPFAPADMPNQFTEFRRAVEKSPARPVAPLSVPAIIPPPPDHAPTGAALGEAGTGGGEASATAHLARYFSGNLPHTYKTTRDQLNGADFSTGFSRWLWSGAVSARTIDTRLRAYEEQNGATDSSYWIRFELLWRDHFRFLHLKHGAALYRKRGLLATLPAQLAHDDEKMLRWREGRTGQPLVDAGMRELAATGFLSNRMRQIVASYLIYELECDWRAGAAWFEAQLIDYDVYSNQGNWLYIAGRGTDPRGGRRFDPERQARVHDPDGTYQRLWSDA
ncbi:DASH family cryptochrome [Oxalobacteraceae bacterium OTU3CINTB1]|nr:DASH family cryptochrome [Oxalobacteraceae bacterium OTU3CINTB1]